VKNSKLKEAFTSTKLGNLIFFNGKHPVYFIKKNFFLKRIILKNFNKLKKHFGGYYEKKHF